MADFDNGLPPAGTVTDGKVSGVVVESEISHESLSDKVSAVTLDKSDAENIEVLSAKAVTLDKEEAGINTLFMYYL